VLFGFQEYEGYLFPKNHAVFINLHAAHHDKEYWGDPEKFRPERFLDDSGKKLIKHEALIPFSTGKKTNCKQILISLQL
jgi:methyl farnesoate epoxidase/farnesoate epoxidase